MWGCVAGRDGKKGLQMTEKFEEIIDLLNLVLVSHI